MSDNVKLCEKPIYIDNSHNRDPFCCREEGLNKFIKQSARHDHENNLSKTYVIIDEKSNIRAYFTLVYENIELKNMNNFLRFSDLREGLVKNSSIKNKIPCVLLGMMAKDNSLSESKEFGLYLLNEAMKKALEASKIAGIKGLFLVPVNQEICKKLYDTISFLTKIEENLYYVPIKRSEQIVNMPITK